METNMHWTGWIVIALAALTGGWMTFDGARALLVRAVGLDPRSTLMKSVFVVYGLALLAGAFCFALGQPWAWWGLLALGVLGLWYLPVGTLASLFMLVLLLLPGLRPG